MTNINQRNLIRVTMHLLSNYKEDASSVNKETDTTHNDNIKDHSTYTEDRHSSVVNDVKDEIHEVEDHKADTDKSH